jgi:pimeloyl-ACP methyl ester carboxylesterase
VLLHGLTDSHRSYEPVLAALPEWIRAYAITQRGHGDASRPESGYWSSDFAADVTGFLDAVGVEKAVIAGHSMGSIVARCFAREHPERTLGLVLAGAFADLDRPDLKGLLEEFRALGDPVDPEYARAWQESNLALPVPDEFFETIVEETVKTPARIWSAAIEGMMTEGPEPHGAIEAATLIVYGDGDAFIPRSDQDALMAAIPQAELIVYEGGGHALHWERPERYAADLARFAATL